jgi:hypothetical protein
MISILFITLPPHQRQQKEPSQKTLKRLDLGVDKKH